MARTIFVGDIHGCAREFEHLLARVGWDAAADRLLLTGDAFTRGPDPRDVWCMIRDADAEMVRGNHEDNLLAWLPDAVEDRDKATKKASRRKFLRAMGDDAPVMLDWIETRPLWIAAPDWLLVHAGIHPTGGLAGSSPHHLLEIRTWPPRKGIVGRRWHDHLAPMEQVVIFGHDAPRRLVLKRRRGGRPYAVGLDTGCVYGGRLTAYVFEEDRVVQVDSRQ